MDRLIIEKLQKLCKFSFLMKEDICEEISFFDPNEILEGTIRRHPDKKQILELTYNLSNLKKISFKKCKLGQIDVSNWKLMEDLDLSSNDLTEIDGFSDFPNLKHLNLGSNFLEKAPEIPNLITFKIHKNRIGELPNLPKTLNFLNLYLNRIPELPVLDLPELIFLSFGVTDTEILPNLPKKLRWLSLVVNKIKKLPDDFCSMSNLEGVRFAKNELEHLPEDIGTMNLKELSLYSNNIKELPDSFYDLKLRKLNVSKNPMDKTRVKKVFENIEFLETDGD